MANNASDQTPFEEFCGGVLWDLNVTWYTDHPDFTPCFLNSVLIWIPYGFLWVALLPYSIFLGHSRGTANPVNKLNNGKTFVGLLLALICLVNTIKAVSDYGDGQDIPLVQIVSPAFQTLTLIIAVILIQAERRKGRITSGVLFIFWLFLALSGIVPFYVYILHSQQDGEVKDIFHFTLFYVYYALVLIQLVISCFSDLKPQDAFNIDGKPCPEIKASFLSYITFQWVNSLVFLGYKKTLDEDDLFDPNPRDVTCNNAPKFEKQWNKELERVGWSTIKQPHPRLQRALSQSGRAARQSLTEGASEKTPLLSGSGKNYRGTSQAEPDDDVEIIEPKKKEPSFTRTLAILYGPTLLKAHACKFICDIMTFLGPAIQSLLIGFTEDKSQEMWKGFVYAALFYVTSQINSVFFHQLFHIGLPLGMRIKCSVIAAVYKKALTMSNDARKQATVGEIVNLMSVDAQRLQDFTGYMWMFWSCPLQIGIAVFMLWNMIGPSVLAGLAVMVLLIPVNGVMATFQRKFQVAQMTQKDSRIKLMNEILNGMKVLKLYAWELSFKEKVDAIRNLELETLWNYSLLQAAGTFTWTCAPFLVTLATFATYVLLGNTLDANKAFVSLSLFNLLRFPINLLPMMVSYLVTASVSMSRLNKFLRHNDVDAENVQHDTRAAHPVMIEKGTFSWGTGKDDMPVLKNITMSVAEGQLTAVVGQVGAGKSSLISAILGEMEKLDGRVNVNGSVAYVAQQAWIQNLTLRDNILFGATNNEDFYDSVIESCALGPDLEILPGGHETEIGEKGINLSGGQKQRVSLARAVYNNADIYLMDDPLSAVDAHVGKHIFNRVMSKDGLLRNKTRLLVTHGVHWLPHVDKIIVLINGEISEMGTYDELLSHNGAFAKFLKAYLLNEDSDQEDATDSELKEQKKKMLERVDSVVPDEDVPEIQSPVSGTSDHDTAGSESGGATGPRRKKKKVPTATLR